MCLQIEYEILAHFYPVLAMLPSGLRRAFLDSCYPVRAAAGQVLADVDAPISSLILLKRGSFRVLRPEQDRELLLYRVRPGDCCVISICHLLGETRYRVRAQVESNIAGYSLPQPLFARLMEESSAFSYFIFHVFAGRFNELLHLLESTTCLHLNERLAELLVNKGTTIRTTHSRLADELGSVREVISRILKDFECRGLVKLGRGRIQILDLDALKNLSRLGDSSH